MKTTSYLTALLAIALPLGGCGFLDPQTSADGSSSEESTIEVDEEGNGSSTFSDEGGEASITSGALAGTSLAIEPGTFSEETQVSFQEGTSLASEELSSELGLGEAVLESAGPAVLISADKDVDASQPMTLSVPVAGAGTGLLLTEKHLVVVYRVRKASDGLYYVGVIHDGVQEGNAIKVKASHFGAYQAIYSSVAVSERIEKNSFTGIQTKKATHKFEGKWHKNCEVDTKGGNGSPERVREQLQITERAFLMDRASYNYDDDSCATPEMVTRMFFDLKLGADSAKVAGAKEADLVMKALYMVIRNADIVTYANANEFCGATGWVLNEPKKLEAGCPSNQSEGGADDGPPPVGHKVYTLFHTDGSTFQLGQRTDLHDESAPEKRPIGLEESKWIKTP